MKTPAHLGDPLAPPQSGRSGPGRSVRKPDFFIVGAPKCGTTTLYAYFRTHPQIFMPDVKEPGFFGGETGQLIRDEASYLSIFASAEQGLVVGEASPWYLYSRTAPREIHTFNPSARIIIMLRQPADFMYSLHNHQHLQSMHGEDIADFAEALAAEPDRREGRRLPQGLELAPCHLLYRDVARFTSQVRRYLETFGPEQVHFILFDDFIRDPQEEFGRACRFLNVRDDVTIRAHNANPARGWRSRTVAHVLYRVPKPLLVAGRIVPSPIRHRVRDTLLKLNVSKGYRKYLDPDLRRQLTIEFTPEIERLADLIGRDLSAWSKT